LKNTQKTAVKKSFLETNMIQAAVIREIEIIGEAAKNLSSKFIETYKNIPWKQIVGMRDKLIHGYFGVDLESVWKTVKEDLQYLRKEIKKIK